MSTPPQTPESSESTKSTESLKSADGPKLWFVALYPLVAGTALMVVGFFALMGTMYDDTSYAALFVLGAAVVIGGAHFWLQYVLEGRDEPLPWQFPTVLSTAMVASIFVMLFPIFMNVELILPLPLVCLGLSLLGVFVFSVAGELGTDRNRLVFALGAILGAVLLIVGVTLWLDGRKQDERKEELLQEVAAFQHPIAVLDDPDWEPTQMWFSDTRSATIIYEPAEFLGDADGFQLRLQTEPIDPEDQRPLHDRCGSDPADDDCEEHGDIVLVDRSSASKEEYQGRAEFADGLMAKLWSDLPSDHQGSPTMDFPDIDMVELTEQVRAAKPGDDEEVVEDIFS